MAVVLDAQPLVAYFAREAGWTAVRDLLTEAANRGERVLVTTVNLAEVLYIAERRRGREAPLSVLSALGLLRIEAVPPDLEMATVAAEIKASNHMSLADCFAAALAKTSGARLVTGDPDFEQVEDEILIIWVR